MDIEDQILKGRKLITNLEKQRLKAQNRGQTLKTINIYYIYLNTKYKNSKQNQSQNFKIYIWNFLKIWVFLKDIRL